jgi:ERCC4-type nuclease
MELVIDYRERGILEILGDTVKPVNLIIGDIVIKKESRDLVIIERKTMVDLISSIKSGRYAEQRERLKLYKEANPGVKIVYLLENCFGGHQSKVLLDGAITNLILFHDISVIYSDNLGNTVDIINGMVTKLKETDISGLCVSQNLPVLKKAKISENMFLLQLCLIPGVSRTISSVIVEKYQTLQEFLGCKPSILEISNLTFGKSNRKIGKKVAERIFLVYFD